MQPNITGAIARTEVLLMEGLPCFLWAQRIWQCYNRVTGHIASAFKSIVGRLDEKNAPGVLSETKMFQ